MSFYSEQPGGVATAAEKREIRTNVKTLHARIEQFGLASEWKGLPSRRVGGYPGGLTQASNSASHCLMKR